MYTRYYYDNYFGLYTPIPEGIQVHTKGKSSFILDENNYKIKVCKADGIERRCLRYTNGDVVLSDEDVRIKVGDQYIPLNEYNYTKNKGLKFFIVKNDIPMPVYTTRYLVDNTKKYLIQNNNAFPFQENQLQKAQPKPKRAKNKYQQYFFENLFGSKNYPIPDNIEVHHKGKKHFIMVNIEGEETEIQVFTAGAIDKKRLKYLNGEWVSPEKQLITESPNKKDINHFVLEKDGSMIQVLSNDNFGRVVLVCEDGTDVSTKDVIKENNKYFVERGEKKLHVYIKAKSTKNYYLKKNEKKSLKNNEDNTNKENNNLEKHTDNNNINDHDYLVNTSLSPSFETNFSLDLESINDYSNNHQSTSGNNDQYYNDSDLWNKKEDDFFNQSLLLPEEPYEYNNQNYSIAYKDNPYIFHSFFNVNNITDNNDSTKKSKKRKNDYKSKVPTKKKKPNPYTENNIINDDIYLTNNSQDIFDNQNNINQLSSTGLYFNNCIEDFELFDGALLPDSDMNNDQQENQELNLAEKNNSNNSSVSIVNDFNLFNTSTNLNKNINSDKEKNKNIFEIEFNSF